MTSNDIIAYLEDIKARLNSPAFDEQLARECESMVYSFNEQKDEYVSNCKLCIRNSVHTLVKQQWDSTIRKELNAKMHADLKSDKQYEKKRFVGKPAMNTSRYAIPDVDTDSFSNLTISDSVSKEVGLRRIRKHARNLTEDIDEEIEAIRTFEEYIASYIENCVNVMCENITGYLYEEHLEFVKRCRSDKNASKTFRCKLDGSIVSVPYVKSQSAFIMSVVDLFYGSQNEEEPMSDID